MVETEILPSNKSVVRTILRAQTREELDFIGKHIRETVISENHDAILKAWNEKVSELGTNIDPGSVVRHIEKQQKLADSETSPAEKRAAVGE